MCKQVVPYAAVQYRYTGIATLTLHTDKKI
jgi:hypothetical protein